MTEAVLSKSTEDTEACGEALASRLLSRHATRAFIALFGEMGVGKTAFIRGFARALQVSSVKSPTYTVVNEYRGGLLPLYHFDMYRIADSDDLYSIGYDDYLEREGFILTEWSERILSDIPEDAIRVTIAKIGDSTERRITIEEI